tara:strand:- start:100 stop:876 length:777 start_codon:yes stop_codon:yes gene_type:complete
VNKTIRDVAIGAGLFGAGIAGSTNFLDKPFGERASRKTGVAVDDPEGSEKILKAHEKYAKGRPEISVGGYPDEPFTRDIEQLFGAYSGSSYIPTKGIVPNDELALGNKASKFLLAHELGHREISQNPKDNPISHAAQEKFYQGVSPLIKVPALAAIGLVSPNTRRALALGLTTQFASQAGELIAENAANRKAEKYFKEAGEPLDKSIPRTQFGNYVINNVLEAAIPIGAGIAARGIVQNPHVRDFLKRKVGDMSSIRI